MNISYQFITTTPHNPSEWVFEIYVVGYSTPLVICGSFESGTEARQAMQQWFSNYLRRKSTDINNPVTI